MNSKSGNAETKILRLGSAINKALDPDKIGEYVHNLAKRIAQFPTESINACKQMVYKSIDKPIDDALALSGYQQDACFEALRPRMFSFHINIKRT